MLLELAKRSRSAKPRVLRGYRRLVVPLVEGPESRHAVDLACRLAADRAASLVAVAVIEVPPLLPLDAYMEEEEAAARALLERAGVTADTYAVRLHPKLTRARMAAEAIVELAQAENAELIVLGARRRTISSASAQSFGGTVKHVLEDAQCRVMLVAPSRERPCARDAA